MAASKNVSQLPQSHNSTVPRHGVVTLFGFGIKIRVERGHLLIDDGISTDRKRFRLPRVNHGLKRLVVIGSDGFVSLAALRWLADQKASFVMLERDGRVLVTTGPVSPSDARLRRIQALAQKSSLALHISRELIARKLAGQERVARLHLLDNQTADRIARYREELGRVEDLKIVSVIEAQAAGHYWAAYQALPVNFPRRDESRLPEYWKTFGNRASPLTGSPRRAANPANAVLNYAYSLLEAESRLAAAAMGLDPNLGFLHHDMPNRDSLSCDLMEAVRPEVDAWLVDWITKDTLRRDWFFEQRDGGCRLMASLAEKISCTSPTWARSVAPIAEWVVQTLWSNALKAPSERRPATRLTQQRRSEGRGKDYIHDATPAPHPANVCEGCGNPTKTGRNCPRCGREISGRKLIELAKLGRTVALSAQSRQKHSETQRRHEMEKREWNFKPEPAWPTKRVYSEEIQPRLSTVTIAKIAFTLGVSESYAAMIRSGRYSPHPRHWQVLGELAGLSRDSQ